MKNTKVNIGVSLSRNFDKITLEMVEEPIEYENEEEFKAKIRKKFSLLNSEVELEFSKIQK